MITIRRISILLAALVAAVARPARAAAPPAETIAEAMFLCDALPPGGRDLVLSVAVAPAEAPDGGTRFAASPRMQLAVALGERVGVTADVGLGTNGVPLDAPGASLKFLLRAPGQERTGLAASLDLYGSSHNALESEAGVGLGAIRTVGPVALRAGASVATGIRDWSPHLHGGASAALALGARVRVLGEVVAMASTGERSYAAGPTVKVALGEGAALSAGLLFPLAGAPPSFTVQIAHGL